MLCICEAMLKILTPHRNFVEVEAAAVLGGECHMCVYTHLRIYTPIYIDPDIVRYKAMTNQTNLAGCPKGEKKRKQKASPGS